MGRSLTLVGVTIAVLVQACVRSPSMELVLSVESSKPTVVAEVRDILTTRFDAVRPSVLSTVTSNIEGTRISFQFSNGAPTNDVLEYLYSTLGDLHASQIDAGSGLTWFTTADIERASAGVSDYETLLYIRLKPEVGERVALLSSMSIGGVMRWVLDGQVILDARVSEEFGRLFQVAAPDPERAKELAVILESGVLPTKVEKVSMKPITRGPLGSPPTETDA